MVSPTPRRPVRLLRASRSPLRPVVVPALFAVAVVSRLPAPHLDYRGVVSYSESEKAQRSRDAYNSSQSSGSSSSYGSSAFSSPSVSMPDWAAIQAENARLEKERKEQERLERVQKEAAERARKEKAAKLAKIRAEQEAIDRHVKAKFAGEENARVAEVLECLLGKPAIPEAGPPFRLHPEDASLHTSQIISGPNAHWAPLWTVGFEVFTGGRPLGGIDRLNREMMEQHPDVALNLAIAGLLDPRTTPAMHPNDRREYEPQFRRLAARALHRLATQPVDARPRQELARTTAALAVHAQATEPGLPLSPEAAQLVERVLRAPGAGPIDALWSTFLGKAAAQAAATPATAPVELEALPHLIRGCTQQIDWILAAVAELKPEARDLRPAWLDDPELSALFRRLYQEGLASRNSRANPEKRRQALVGLEQLVSPMSPEALTRFNQWVARARDFEDAPKDKRTVLAPQILLDALDGSPDASLHLAEARALIEKPHVPEPAEWPALDALARNHAPRLKSPRIELMAAIGLVRAGGKLTGGEPKLLQALLGPRPPADFTADERVRRFELMPLLPAGVRGAIEAALATARATPSDPVLPRILAPALAHALQELAYTPEPTLEQIERALEVAVALGRAAPTASQRHEDPRAPSLVIPYLLDLRRTHFPAYPTSPAGALVAKILEVHGTSSDLSQDSVEYLRPVLDDLVKLARAERDGPPQQRTALDALGRLNARIYLHRGLSDQVQSIYERPPTWWVRHGPNDTWPVDRHRHPADGYRIVLRDRAEMFALTLMAYFKTGDDAPERAALKDTIRRLAYSPAHGLPAWELLGRDLGVGGLATRALLAEQLLEGPTGKNEGRGLTAPDAAAGFERWLRAVGELVSRVPAHETIDELVQHIVEPTRFNDRYFRGLTVEGLANATEVVTHDAADTIGSASWRRYALGKVVQHAPRLTELVALDRSGRMPAMMPAFIVARAEWELSRIDQPKLTPLERARPIVARLGASATALAFMARTKVSGSYEPPISVERQFLLEPDPAFAPALIRAAEKLPDQETLIAAYLDNRFPQQSGDWLALSEGRYWAK